jgi:hypothetical protein
LAHGAAQGAALPEPEQGASRKAAKRGRQQPTPWWQRLGGVHQASAVIAQKQAFQTGHRMAKQGNRERGEDADQHGDKHAAKHNLNIRISVKTMHQRIRLTGNGAYFYRE